VGIYSAGGGPQRAARYLSGAARVAMILSLQRLLQAATAVAAGRSDAELRAEVDALEKEAMLIFREWAASTNGADRDIQRKKHEALGEVEGRLHRSLRELYTRETESMIADLHVRYDNAPIGEVEAAYDHFRYFAGSGMDIPQNPTGLKSWYIRELHQARASALLQLIQLKKTPA